jgi:[acyl-carrier-protein] S-malonyltransferase
MGENRAVVGGLSLGEFGALCAAEVLSAEVCLDLLLKRQILMDSACAECPGSMAAVLGMDATQLEKICREVGRVVIANFNSPSQLVVSGDSEAVAEVVTQVAQNHARAIRLKVAGAFHSPLMDKASTEFASILRHVIFVEPTVPFYSSVSGERVERVEVIRALLCRQMNSPVLFEGMVRNMCHDEVTEFVEVGEAGVITRLVPEIVGHGVG